MSRFFTMPGEWTEWGYRLDCAKNGCDPKHGDDGRVLPVGRTVDKPYVTPRRPREGKVNGHATTIVRHTVTVSEWEAS